MRAACVRAVRALDAALQRGTPEDAGPAVLAAARGGCDPEATWDAILQRTGFRDGFLRLFRFVQWTFLEDGALPCAMHVRAEMRADRAHAFQGTLVVDRRTDVPVDAGLPFEAAMRGMALCVALANLPFEHARLLVEVRTDDAVEALYVHADGTVPPLPPWPADLGPIAASAFAGAFLREGTPAAAAAAAAADADADAEAMAFAATLARLAPAARAAVMRHLCERTGRREPTFLDLTPVIRETALHLAAVLTEEPTAGKIRRGRRGGKFELQ